MVVAACVCLGGGYLAKLRSDKPAGYGAVPMGEMAEKIERIGLMECGDAEAESGRMDSGPSTGGGTGKPWWRQ